MENLGRQGDAGGRAAGRHVMLTKIGNCSILLTVKKMNFIREIQKVDDNVITIELPLDYKNTEVEILVLPVEGFHPQKMAKRRSFESLKYISIDTRAYKFNREELHER